MRLPRVERQEAELEEERRAKFKGTACIRLESLDFPRQGANENAERLKLCIECEGCYRVDSKYHVSAVIDQELLDGAVAASNTSYAALSSNASSQWPTLRFPPGVRLKCLRGWDRLRAGWEVLPPKDRWWTVDLFLSNINKNLEKALREGFLNQERPSPGQILRNIRLCILNDDFRAERQWWARVHSKNQRLDLRRLLRHDRYMAALDPFLDLPALWEGIWGGMWKKVMDTKCEEEVFHYLGHMRAFWPNLLQNDPQWMQRLDPITVKALQRRAPGVSIDDFAYLYDKIGKGAMFHAFNEWERITIVARLKSFDGLVPSFSTFFDNFKCLEIWAQCAKILQRVNPDPEGPGRTVFTALEQAFDETNQNPDHCIIQTAESVFTTIPGAVTDRVQWGYRQLFLYVMRHHREMIPGSTRMELKGRRKGIKGIHIPEAPNKAMWCRFAALADRLGFASTEITSLKSSDEGDINIPSDRAPPSFITAEPGELDKRRSGRPFDLAYEQSRNALFLDGVHSANQSQGRGITPFFVRRSTYLAFLGHVSFPGQTAPRTPPAEAVVEHPQETHDESMSGQDAGQADQDQRDPAQRDASHEASEGPSLPQTSQECIPEETREEAHPVSENELLPQQWPPQWEAVLEENIERVEPQSGYGRWGSEAPSMLGSSYYSTEDEEVLGPTVAHAGDEGHVSEVTSSSKVGIKFFLREGDGWVEQENLSIDRSSPALVEHIAEKHTRKSNFLFNTALRGMAPSECFEAVVGDGTNMVLLIPEGSINIDHELETSARKLCIGAGGTGGNQSY